MYRYAAPIPVVSANRMDHRIALTKRPGVPFWIARNGKFMVACYIWNRMKFESWKSVKCLDCHFLVRHWRGEPPKQWTQEDIENLQPAVSPKSSGSIREYCFMGEWDGHAGANVTKEVQIARRPSSCSYLERTEGLTLEGGRGRIERVRRVKDSRKITAGLFVASATLLIAALNLLATCSD